jgi:hypothetical protein
MIVDDTSWMEELEAENRPSKRERLRKAINKFAMEKCNGRFGDAWVKFYDRYSRETCKLPAKD